MKRDLRPNVRKQRGRARFKRYEQMRDAKKKKKKKKKKKNPLALRKRRS